MIEPGQPGVATAQNRQHNTVRVEGQIDEDEDEEKVLESCVAHK